MPNGDRRLFAGRGIPLRWTAITIATVGVAFGLGIAAGWGSGLIADRFGTAQPSASPSTSPSPSESPVPTPTVEVSVPPLEPVTRAIDDDDRAAGLRTLEFPVQGEGTFTTISAPESPSADTTLVKYVRIDVEDGLQVSDGQLASFVMAGLNDAQGWGREGPTTFVQTEGAPDVRVILASPYTAAALCADPHEPAPLEVETSATPSPSPSPAASTSQCPANGAIVVSVYDWIQGLPPYGDDRTGARNYFLNHAYGHIRGLAEATCRRGVAHVMATQSELREACTPNPWPFPEE